MGGLFGALFSSLLGSAVNAGMGALMGGGEQQQGGGPPPAAGAPTGGPGYGTPVAQTAGPKSITPGGGSVAEYQASQGAKGGVPQQVGGASGFAPPAGASQVVGSTSEQDSKVF